MNPISAYTRWLHTRWPAGTVEKLPEANEDGTTTVNGIRIVGDLTGIPLLKFSSHTGAKAVQAILAEPGFQSAKSSDPQLLDIAIIGAGVSGVAAAMEAKTAGLNFKVFEASEIFSTVVNFPKAKPIYTYPTDMIPAGKLQFKAKIKEALLDEMEVQRKQAGVDVTFSRVERIERKGSELLLHHEDKKVTRARRVIVAIGRSGNHRKLGVPGENLDKVFNRLYDPMEFHGKHVLVVGGGDSALEAAIALTLGSADVTLSYRKKEFARPKPENVEKIEMLKKNPDADVSIEHPSSERVTTSVTSGMRKKGEHGTLNVALSTKVKEILNDRVILVNEQNEETVLKNDVVFTMIGREAPLDFFRRSGISIRGEWKLGTWVGFISFVLFCIFMYNWKTTSSSLNKWFQAHHWFPYNITSFFASLGGTISQIASDHSNLFGTIVQGLRDPSFYYTFAYCACVVLFGIRRIKRRQTPYVKAQTLTLMAIQVIPLFILPQILLPWMGYNGWFEHGFGKSIADALFPVVKYGHGREYWRASGLILAWPLFIWNVFTGQPLWWWLGISFAQTFIIIPLIIYFWGKGAYCGWICSCGALAETMGDAHRQKMPHGPFWNRMNMVGQVVLFAALALLIARIWSWTSPQSSFGMAAGKFYKGLLNNWSLFGIQLNYYYVVDIFLAGIIGVGMYFWFSGRVWCRFACPLAALMHIYARFSRFRIFAEKSKCISCNVCTSVCHQGIDIMNFANKGIPMEDPECVRCSACVQQCPTGTLSFGRYGKDNQPRLDIIPASLVRLKEK